MDIFGIGNAIRGCTINYFAASRATGRTTAMVDALKDGDRVYFADDREADRVRRMCRARDLDVECMTRHIDGDVIGSVMKIYEDAKSRGRVIFDHTWVERYYLARIEDCYKLLEQLTKDCSGFGAEHYKTREKAREIAKFPPLGKNPF